MPHLVSSCTHAARFRFAGGHEGAFQNSGAVLEKIVGPREKRFYEQAYQGRWPPGFLPSYHGDKGDGRIGIENLMYGMKCPCVIDLKMGTATVEAAENNFMKKMKMNTLDMVTGSSAHGVFCSSAARRFICVYVHTEKLVRRMPWFCRT